MEQSLSNEKPSPHKKRFKAGPLPEETLKDLVAELNARRRKRNSGLSFDLTSDGELRVVVVYE